MTTSARKKTLLRKSQAVTEHYMSANSKHCNMVPVLQLLREKNKVNQMRLLVVWIIADAVLATIRLHMQRVCSEHNSDDKPMSHC